MSGGQIRTNDKDLLYLGRRKIPGSALARFHIERRLWGPKPSAPGSSAWRSPASRSTIGHGKDHPCEWPPASASGSYLGLERQSVVQAPVVCGPAHLTLSRPCVRHVFCCLAFSLVSPLPSIASAAGFPALFGNFAGTIVPNFRLRQHVPRPL